MKQTSLFSDPADSTEEADTQARRASTRAVLAVPAGPAGLNKAQQRFNKLIGKIDLQRRMLDDWADYLPRYRQKVQAEFMPLQQRLRDKRIEMVELLDQAMDGKALGKTHRAKVEDILLGQLSDLLADEETPELVRLYDKHSHISFAETKQEDLELTQAVASSLFGVELDADELAASPDELAELIAEKMRVEGEKAEQARAARAAKRRGKAGKGEPAAAATPEPAAQEANHALRDIYRKLVSELHPDREPDPAERARKTALMQQVNQAYGANDLRALLELQLATLQIDAASLANMAQDRLARYNQVLEEQVQRLQQQLRAVTEPFSMVLGARGRGDLTPAQVERALADDRVHLLGVLGELEEDLLRFQDVKALKSSLRHYRLDDDDVDVLDALMTTSKKKRRR